MSCCNCTPTAAEKEDEKYSEWRVDSALRAIREAEEAKADPKMMAKIQEKLNIDKKVIRSIEELRNVKTTSEDDE